MQVHVHVCVYVCACVCDLVKEMYCNYKHRTHLHGYKNNCQYRKYYDVFGKVVIQLTVLVPIILDFILFLHLHHETLVSPF